MEFRTVLGTLLATSLVAPLAAESETGTMAVFASNIALEETSNSEFRRFTPASSRREHRIDYAHWDEALAWMVVPMGPSIRAGAPRVDARTGTRRVYGHESRYRLEGNRLAFSYLTPDLVTALTDYRADLERVGGEVGLTSLPRNEQLAFWLNLHNVAVAEALAKQYPVSFVDDEHAVDDQKLVTVSGVALSPRDIREKIVYPNWRDPKVLYGFWRGVIGGPTIQRLAFTGGNVDALLGLSAEEFVNSLRGVERWGGTLQLSPIYDEASAFYFSDDAALRAHLAQYARDEVRELVSGTERVAYKPMETDLADLARGERDPGSNFLSEMSDATGAGGQITVDQARPVRTRVNLAIQRLMRERSHKLRVAARRGIRTGMVIYGDGDYSDGEAPPEVR